MIVRLIKSLLFRRRARTAGDASRDQSVTVGARLRRIALSIVIVVATTAFAVIVHQRFPLQEWFFWRYVVYFALAAVFSASCLAFGHALLDKLLRRPLPILEHLSMCSALGILSFFTFMFIGGLFMAYGALFFVALPATMLALGARPSYRYLCRLVRHLRHQRRVRPEPFRPAQSLLCGLGLLALAAFYIPAVAPSPVGYDSAWYHIPIAEHYVALGGIRPFEEGWHLGTIAQLPSLLYTWAYQLPSSTLFDRVELCAHVEFTCALMTLIGIPALVRRLVPRTRVLSSWVAYFSFPCVFYYNLLIGADQISAVWAVPLTLALLRTYQTLDPRYGLLLAATVAGVMLTKFSSYALLVAPAFVIAARALWLAGRSLSKTRSLRDAVAPPLRGLSILLAVLALSSPLWLKNWLWYGDPFYPVLHQYFASRPWTEDASTFYDAYQEWLVGYHPPRSWEGVKETLWAVITYGFSSSDFSVEAKGAAPFRGALFSLACLCLPFIKALPRAWAVAGLGNAAILCWYWVLHQDRYLMALVPLMAAFSAAVLVLVWRTSVVARVCAVAAITLHTIWSLRVFTYAYPMRQYSELLGFMRSASLGKKDAGMTAFKSFLELQEHLPPDAKVLLHDIQLHAGLERQSVSDWPALQSGISYARFSAAAGVYDKLREMGVTHVVWPLRDSFYEDSLAGDLRFYEFATQHTSPTRVGSFKLGALPKTRPPETGGRQLVAFFGCYDQFKPGLYPFSALAIPSILNPPPSPEPSVSFTTETDLKEATRDAHFLVYRPGCGFSKVEQLSSEFSLIGARAHNRLYARKQ